MSKRAFRIGIAILALITIFIFCFTNSNDKTSASQIERTLKPINKSASDNDITFTIGDVVKDGHERVHLEYHIKTKKNLNFNEMEDSIVDPYISINGKLIKAVSTVSTTKLGKNEYRGVIEISPEKELPNHYAVNLSLDSVLNQNGQWSINFSL
ncbi:DUF4179 domain-containing protein [Peribacillus simplex]|uniref:DUF4179 domain-containing protein n=1 Tax=Peribacillus TaxID=2675229 RepID=UPI0025A2763E|nr:DUF4179 domain-containing protein [Peribacillus simplex]MDM5291859.1 DUF4179 domain-containing protein [Peribacillus simplex]